MKKIQIILEEAAVKPLKSPKQEDVKGGVKQTTLTYYELKSQSSPPRWKDTE